MVTELYSVTLGKPPDALYPGPERAEVIKHSVRWIHSSAINYGADVPVCVWNFDWHDVRAPTIEQQYSARKHEQTHLRCTCDIAHNSIINAGNHTEYWYAVTLFMHCQRGIQLQHQYWSDLHMMLFHPLEDSLLPKFSASAFQSQTDKCMLMCWQDLKSEMRQPVFSDQSCVTKPEPQLFPISSKGPGWPQ